MADVLAVRDEYRAQTWAMLIQECKTSGMTNKEFCELRGVSEKSFYYWQRKFWEQIFDAAAPQLVPLDSLSEQKELLQIRFRGAELKLPADVDIETVAALLCSIQGL
jgi:putative transposase